MRRGLGERLRRELGSGFGVEGAPGEVPEHVLGMPPVQLDERHGLRPRREEQLGIAALVHLTLG